VTPTPAAVARRIGAIFGTLHSLAIPHEAPMGEHLTLRRPDAEWEQLLDRARAAHKPWAEQLDETLPMLFDLRTIEADIGSTSSFSATACSTPNMSASATTTSWWSLSGTSPGHSHPSSNSAGHSHSGRWNHRSTQGDRGVPRRLRPRCRPVAETRPGVFHHGRFLNRASQVRILPGAPFSDQRKRHSRSPTILVLGIASGNELAVEPSAGRPSRARHCV
jgi:hypothetical protein